MSSPESSPSAPSDPRRRRYSDAALASIPRLLGLVDRNRYSPTYGCFDRSYWHYRTMDFPCGMSQEFVLPLALAYVHPFPDNRWHGLERVREIALAGVDFARRSSHRDGSCDDYFPFEQALGALVFSLYAMSETCLLLDDRRPEFLEFLARRGAWLLRHNESGRLANHQALAALALHNVRALTGDRRFAEGRDEYLRIVRSWQSPEGWFQEYEGADPGYHSCSIAYLGKLLKKLEAVAADPERAKSDATAADGVASIVAMLDPAVDFAWCFMHPDGSYAGEYGSRNTYHFFPHGFEVMGPRNPRATQVADQFLNLGLPNGRRYFNDDDRMCAHYVYDWMQAYLDFSPERNPEPLNARPNFTRYFEGAGLLVRKTDAYYAVAALHKGGVLKVTTPEGPIASDAGLIGRVADGRVIVSHLMREPGAPPPVVTGLAAGGATGDDAGGPGEDADAVIEARVSGPMCRRRSKLATPTTQILFRVLNLTAGRFASNLLRTVLQKILITGKPTTEYGFERTIRLTPDAIEVSGRVKVPPGAPPIESMHVASDATSIYVANSNTYQDSVLAPWRDLTDRARDAGGGSFEYEVRHETRAR